MSTRISGYAKPGHRAVGAVPQLLEEHHATEPAEHDHVGIGGAHLAHLHRRRLVLELEAAELRRRGADARDDLDAHQQAADRGREILDDDRDIDRVRDGAVVPLERGVVDPRHPRRRHHHGGGPELLGALAVGDAPVRARVSGPDADRKVGAGRLDSRGDDPVAFGLGELVGFAEHAQDGHAVHAPVTRERGQPPQALEIQRPIVVERAWA